MATTDPLIALRSAIHSKFEIKYTSSSAVSVSSLHAAAILQLSPTLTLPKATPTRFRKPSATSLDPNAAPNDFVTLEALLVAWLARDASVAEYMKQVREAGIGAFVSITERKGVVEWLEGIVTDHERIVPLAGELELRGLHMCLMLRPMPSRRTNNPTWGTTARLRDTPCPHGTICHSWKPFKTTLCS
jgi:parafibromin